MVTIPRYRRVPLARPKISSLFNQSCPDNKRRKKIDKHEFFGSKVIKDLGNFKNTCDVIVANRMTECLKGVDSKCFTRDLFGNN